MSMETSSCAPQSRAQSLAVTTKQIADLTRFTILCTVALAVVLLMADCLGRGWSTASLRFLSENVVIAFVYGTTGMLISAIAAVCAMALRKS